MRNREKERGPSKLRMRARRLADPIGEAVYISKYSKARYAADPERFKAESKATRLRAIVDNPVLFVRRRFECQVLRRVHHITRAVYDQMLIFSAGCCYHCNKQADLHIDHCHQTGRVRGLLCMRCNTSLGQLGDTEEAIERLLQYLRGVFHG